MDSNLAVHRLYHAICTVPSTLEGARSAGAAWRGAQCWEPTYWNQIIGQIDSSAAQERSLKQPIVQRPHRK
jgi:hypothetical protein